MEVFKIAVVMVMVVPMVMEALMVDKRLSQEDMDLQQIHLVVAAAMQLVRIIVVQCLKEVAMVVIIVDMATRPAVMVVKVATEIHMDLLVVDEEHMMLLTLHYLSREEGKFKIGEHIQIEK